MTDEIRERHSPPPPAAPGNFEFNHPTVVSLLYLGGFITGISMIVGVILAYVWKGEAGEPEWTQSHYGYLIRTFWIGLIGTVVGIVLTIVLIGVFIIIGTAALVITRSVMSLLAAQKRAPMPNPDSWTV